ncbi:unnamed protein product, partial [marine sediment metagenome]
ILCISLKHSGVEVISSTPKLVLHAQIINTNYPFLFNLSQTYGAPYIEFAKKNVDPLCDIAAISTNPEERTELYEQLLKIAHDQAISIYLYQPTGNHVERTWVKGWHYNP